MAQKEQVRWGEGSTPATSRAAVQPREEVKDSLATCCRCSPPRPSPPWKFSLPSKQRRTPAQRIHSPATTTPPLSPILLLLFPRPPSFLKGKVDFDVKSSRDGLLRPTAKNHHLPRRPFLFSPTDFWEGEERKEEGLCLKDKRGYQRDGYCGVAEESWLGRVGCAPIPADHRVCWSRHLVHRRRDAMVGGQQHLGWDSSPLVPHRTLLPISVPPREVSEAGGQHEKCSSGPESPGVP
jgi:hypothetical protein